MSADTKGTAPRTWFAARQHEELDPNRLAAEAIGVVLAAVLVPVGVVVGFGMYGIARWRRWRWQSVVMAGVVLVVVVGLATVVFQLGEWFVDPSRQLAHEWAGGQQGSAGEWSRWLSHHVLSDGALGVIGGGVAWAVTTARQPSWRASAATPATRKDIDTQKEQVATGSTDIPGAVALGVNRSAKTVYVSVDALDQHVLIVGPTGTGKTTTILAIVSQLMAMSVGVVFVDMKGDRDLSDRLLAMGESFGKPTWEWSFAGPCVWNPLARGDYSELTDKLFAIHDPNMNEFYAGVATRYLQKVFVSLQMAGETPSLSRVVTLMDDPKAFANFIANSSMSPDDKSDVKKYLDGLNAKHIEGAQGFATRVAVLAESVGGQWLEPRDGRRIVDVGTVLDHGGVASFRLGSLQYQKRAPQFGAFVLQDIKNAAAARLEKRQRQPLGCIVVDEFSALDGNHILDLLVRARQAGLSVILATQELADLDVVSEQFRKQVLGNTNVKIIHRQDVPESAEIFASMAGTETVWNETLQMEHRSGIGVVRDRGAATGLGSLRKVEQFRLHPNELKNLRKGEIVLMVKEPQPTLEHMEVVPRLPPPADVADVDDIEQQAAEVARN